MYVDERLKLYINKWVVDRVSYFKNLMYFQIHITNRCIRNPANRGICIIKKNCKLCRFRFAESVRY